MAPILILAAMIACTVAANILMKLGAGDPPEARLLNIVSLKTLLGLAAFGCAAVFYTFILKVFPLNVAQSLAAAQFVAVICAAAFFLGEPIGWVRWLGIGLISGGIVVVALSYGAQN